MGIDLRYFFRFVFLTATFCWWAICLFFLDFLVLLTGSGLSFFNRQRIDASSLSGSKVS